MVKCKALTGSAVKGLNFCTAQVTTMKFTYARRQINAGAKPKNRVSVIGVIDVWYEKFVPDFLPIFGDTSEMTQEYK